MHRLQFIDNDTEDRLWSSGRIVFDTCALNAVYRMVPSIGEIMLNILKHFRERIWLPAHVVYEYHKNRETVITNVFVNRYPHYPKSTINKFVEDMAAVIKKLEDAPEYHPFVDAASLTEIKNLHELIKSKEKELVKKIGEEFKKREDEIKATIDHDTLLELVDTLYHGEHYSHTEMLDIYREGEFRYRHKLPPGYEDYDQKQGMQKFGDLIVWKQTIKFAKEQGSDIIFVTEDKKEDWFSTVKIKDKDKDGVRGNGKDEYKKIKVPRIELLKEFVDETDHHIYVYTLSQFIDQLINRCSKDDGMLPLYDGFERLREWLNYFERERLRKEREIRVPHMSIQCSDCKNKFDLYADDVYLDWEMEDHEIQGIYEAFETGHGEIRCPHCDHAHIVEAGLSTDSLGHTSTYLEIGRRPYDSPSAEVMVKYLYHKYGPSEIDLDIDFDFDQDQDLVLESPNNTDIIKDK